jgi:hypothetical protein
MCIKNRTLNFLFKFFLFRTSYNHFSMKLFYTVIAVLLFSMHLEVTAQTNYYSQSATNLHLVANWNTMQDGSGTAPANFTDNDQIFNIDETPTATIAATWTVSGTGSKVVVGDGVTTLTFSSGTLVISGTFDVQASATLNVGSNSAFTLGTCASGSTVNYSLNNTQQIPAGTYHHLSLTNATSARTKTALGNITVNGDLTVTANHTFAMSTFQMLGNPGTITNAGTISTNHIATASPLPSGETWPGTLTFSGAGTQTVPAAVSYQNLTISNGSNVKTSGGDLTVSGVLTLSAVLDMSTFQLISVGTPTITGTLRTGNVSAAPIPSGLSYPGTVMYNSTSSQTVVPATYVALNTSGGDRTYSSASAIIISGAWTTGSGTLDFTSSTVELSGVAAQALTITGQTSLTLNNLSLTANSVKTFSNTGAVITINGTLDIPNSSRTLALGTNRLVLGGGAILSGTGILTTTHTATTTPVPTGMTWPYHVQFNATTTQSVPAGTYESFTSAGAGNANAQGDITVNTNLAVTGALVMQTFQLFGIAGTISGTSTLTTSHTATAASIPAGKTWTCTVAYGAATNQTIVGGTYNAGLQANGGASSVKSVTGDLAVGTTLTIAASTILDLTTFALTSVGTFANSGTIRTANTSATPIPSNQAIGGTVEYNSTDPQTVVPATYTNLNTTGGNRTYSTASNIKISGTWTTGSGTIDLTGTTIELTGTTQALTITGQTSLVFNNLSFTTGAGVRTFSNTGVDITINGILDLSATRTLSMGTNRLLLGGGATLSGAGSLITNSLHTDPLPASTTWPYSVTYSAATQNVTGGTYETLIISTTGTKSAQGDIAVNTTLNVSATLNMQTSLLSGAFSNTGTGTISTTNTGATPFAAGKTWLSTVIYAAAANQTIVAGAYANVQANGGSSVSKTLSGDISVSATLTVAASTILDLSTFAVTAVTTFTNAGTVRIPGTLATPIPADKIIAGTVEYNSTDPQTVVTGTYTNLNTSGGDRTYSSTNTIKISGTWTTGSGTLDLTGTTIDLMGTTQTITITGQTSLVFNNLSLTTASGTKTVTSIASDITVNGTLNLSSSTRILNIGTNRLLLGGGATLSGNGGLITNSVHADPLPASKTWPYSVTYSAVTQNVMDGTYETLVISTAGTKSAQGNVVVNTSLNVSATLNMQTFTLTGTYVPTGTGTIQTQNTSAAPVTAGKTWTQSFFYNAAGVSQNVIPGQYGTLTLTGGDRVFDNSDDIRVSGTMAFGTGTITTTGSTLVINGATTQTLTLPAGGVTFNDFDISAGTVKTISTGPMGVTGELSIASGATLTLGTNLLTAANTVSGTGTVTTSNTGATPIPSGINWPYAFVFNANGTQTIPAGTFGLGLSCTGTSGVGSRIKTMSGDVTVGGGILNINSFAALAIGAHTLTINAVLTQTGFITGGATSNIVIGTNASDAGSLLMTQTSATTRSVNNFTLSRATGADAVIIGNPLRVLGTITITDGTLNGNGNLTFVSSSATTSAQLAEVTGSGNTSGNFITQRYIVGRVATTNSKWRFLTSTVTTSNGIDDNWQQQIHITGPGTGGTFCPTLTSNSNGFDATSSGNPSFYTWDKITQAWVGISNTNATELEAGKGYRVFVRGDRVVQLCNIMATIPLTPNDVTLSATGTLAVGTQNFTCATMASGYELIGNPFQATIDWDAAGVTKTNLAATVFGLKPDGTVNGAYGSWNAGVGTNGMTQYISPGTSIWVQTNVSGNGTLSIAESAKVTSQGGFGYFKTAVPNVFRIKLSMDTLEAIDEVAFVQKDGTSWSYDMSEDARKFGFASNQLALFIPGSTDKYAICRVPSFDSLNNRVNIDAKTVIGNNYRFDFSGLSTFTNATGAILTDTYTGTTQDLSANAVYAFTTPDAASILSGRFYIIFSQNSSSLPVKLISFEGKRNQLNGTDLTWKTASEINSDKFEVERSTDAKTFKTIGSVKASRLSRITKTYTWTDATPAAANVNYYRLKQYDRDGSYIYSGTIAVSFANDMRSTLTAADIKLYPVPVKEQLVIEVNSDKLLVNPAIRMYDMFGKLLNVPMEMENGRWIVNTDRLAEGVYIIQLENNGVTTQLKVIKN